MERPPPYNYLASVTIKLLLQLQLTQQRKESQLRLPMKLQSSQKNPHHLQLLVPKTQRLMPHQRNQKFQLTFILPKMLLSETILLMLSLLKKFQSVPKLSEPPQNTFQLQSTQLSPAPGKKLISLKLQLTQRPLLLQHQKDQLMLILLRMLLSETILLMLSPLKKLKLVLKRSELNQLILQLQPTQLLPPPGRKLISLKKFENSVE